MTTDQRKAQLAVGVDATGARAGFDQVKAGAKDMAQAVAQAGQQGAKGLDGIGAGGDGAAQKLDKATRSMIGSVQRATAAMESGGRGTAQYLETLAKQRGANVDVLKPYLDEMRKVEAAQQAATKSLGTMGISAGQTAAALRSVPAQFTDIITSLQGGQAPMTVLLQQGGQLKDMFGGAGAAAKALGGYVLGMINPFTLAAGAVGVLGFAYSQGSAESKEFNKTLIMTGGVAGVTSGQLSAMSQSLSSFGATQGKVADSLNLFAQAGISGATSLQRFTLAAVQLEKVGGAAVGETAKAFAELGRTPLEASIKLNASMNYLTASTYEHIKALTDQGKMTQAAAVAQNAYSDAIESRTSGLANNLGFLERAWTGIGDVAKWSWDKMLDVGREDSLEQKLKKARDQLDTLAKIRDLDSGRGGQLSALDAVREKKTQGDSNAMSRTVLRQMENATAEAERAKTVKAMAEWDKQGNQFLSEKLKLEREITKARNEGAEAGKTQAQIEERVAAIREKYRDKSKGPVGDPFAADRSAAKEWAQYYEAFTDLTDKATAKTEGLSAAQLKLQQYLVSPAYANATEDMRQLVLQQAYGAVAAEDLAKSQATLAKSHAEFSNARNAELVRSGAEVAALEGRAQALEDEVLAYGLGKEAVAAMTIARLEERKAILQQFEGSEQQIQLIEQEIAARQRLAKAQDSLNAKEASANAAKKAQEDWARAAERIEQSITDSLMRGFESGKGFAENLRDTVVNMFKTMVLRPVVEVGVRGSLSLLGMGGVSGVASAADALGGASTAANGFSGLGGLSALGGLTKWFTDFGGSATSAIIKGGELAYSAGFESIGSSMMGLAEAGNFSAMANGLNMVGDGLGYLNAAVAASQGRWGAAAGSAIGTYFGGPIGAAIGNAVGEHIDQAFGGGHEYTTGTGISGTFNRQGFMGRNYQDWRNDGGSIKAFGVFGPSLQTSSSSSGTNYSALDAGTAKGLSKAFLSVQGQTAAFAATLGLSADNILNFSKDIRLALGADAEANKKAIEKLLTGIADDLARTVLDSQYIREGEAAASTLARLASSLSAVNASFDVLGKSPLLTGQAGGDAASQLVDLLGGLDKFTTTTLSYYQAFYTEAERNAKTAEQLSASFASLGVAVPDSLQAYRDLVNAQDVNTDAGRQMFVALMGLSGAFATVTNAATAASSALVKAMNFSTYADYAAAAAGAGLTPTPRFAAGGMHAGGLRIVGEDGPELEATGPSRIWNDAQLRSVLDGGGQNATASELSALRSDFRAQSRSQVSINARILKLFELWDANGMPEVRTV